MTTAAQVIYDVSKYLTDQEADYEYTHWEQDDLFTYLKLALAIVASTDKGRYTKNREVKLVAGSLQYVPETCLSARVRGSIDPISGKISLARHISMDPSKAVDRPICAKSTKCDAGYKVESWSAQADDDEHIWVYPPVPEGIDATLILSCFTPPSPNSMDEELDIDVDKLPALFELMLYYAFGVDIESVSMRERSETHFNKAYTLLGIAVSAAGTIKGKQ